MAVADAPGSFAQVLFQGRARNGSKALQARSAQGVAVSDITVF